MSKRLAAFALQDFKAGDQSVSVIVCAFDPVDAKLAADHIEAVEARAAQLEAERDDYGRKYSALMQASGARILELKAERDEARRQLKQARKQISNLRAELSEAWNMVEESA